ncbi:hypothetical protein HaLaN_08656, partial [Haematococcus lacustris]
MQWCCAPCPRSSKRGQQPPSSTAGAEAAAKWRQPAAGNSHMEARQQHRPQLWPPERRPEPHPPVPSHLSPVRLQAAHCPRTVPGGTGGSKPETT